MNNILLYITALILPILLWPIEYLLPYPYIIEELSKYASLALLKKKSPKHTISLKTTILFGLFFTLSESMLYMMNLFITWQLELLPKRILLTGILHITTAVIIGLGIQQKKLIKITSLVLAMSLHYVYNQFLWVYFV